MRCGRATSLTNEEKVKAADFSRTAISEQWSIAELVVAAKNAAPNPWFNHVAREFLAERARARKRSSNGQQAPLQFAKSVTKKSRNALALCVHSATTSSSLRSLESPALTALLERCGVAPSDVPTRRDIANSLPLVYNYVMSLLEKELHAADSFSVCFDLWSSRRLKNSFIALVFRWVDKSGSPHEQIFDLIHMGARPHTGANIALLVAERIDRHTTEQQFLAGSLTDNARNVINASHRIVFQLALLLSEGAPADVVVRNPMDAHVADGDRARIVTESADLRNAVANEVELEEEGDEDELEEDVDLSNLDDVELARVAACVIHSMMLAIKATVEHADAHCATLKRAIRKADRLTAAVLRSTKLQLSYSNYQKVAGPAHDQRALVRRALTRWHSLHDSAQSVVLNGDVLQAMAANGEFAACSTPVDALADRELDSLDDIVRVLAPIKVECKLLECRDVFILPALPFLVKHLFDGLANIRANPPARYEGNAALLTFVDVLTSALHVRLDKYLTDGHQPALMCALLAPWCGTRGLQSIGISDEVIAATVASVSMWCTDIEKTVNPNGLNGAINNLFLGGFAQQQVDTGRLGACVQRVLNLISGPSQPNQLPDAAQAAHAAAYPVPVGGSWSAELLKDLSSAITKFYFDVAVCCDIAEAKRVVAVLYSLSGASAVCEQALSSTGRTDSALRSRLAPTTLEQLTIVQEYCTRNNVDIKTFLSGIEREIALQ